MIKSKIALSLLVAGSIFESGCQRAAKFTQNVEIALNIDLLCRENQLKTQECIRQITRNIDTEFQLNTSTQNLGDYYNLKAIGTNQNMFFRHNFTPKTKQKLQFHTRKYIVPSTNLYVAPKDLLRTKSQLELNSFLISNNLRQKFECKFDEDTNIVICRSITPNLTIEEVNNLSEFLERKEFTIQIKEDFLIGIK